MKDQKTLIDILMRHAPESRSFHTKIKDFLIARRDTSHIIERCMIRPCIFLTVQGKKCSVLGKAPYEYGAGKTMVLGMNLPADGWVLEASPEKPYLSMILGLEPALITQILAELPEESIDENNQRAVVCSQTEPAMLEAFTRLAELLDTPEHIQYLAPLLIREIHYRLLTGPQGKHVRAINMIGTQSNQISRAITWLENNYRTTIKIEELANHVNMAVSTFHRNFKRITALSPLQFQKKLRLLEAQRLMLIENLDAVNACYEVGYESPTQFSREYKRMFGNPPLKNIRAILSLAS
jgi:AraC-like DNA-binding protein